MTKSILKYNIFEFHGKVNLQISGTEIGSKFAPPFACIYIDEVETDFFKNARTAATYMASMI